MVRIVHSRLLWLQDAASNLQHYFAASRVPFPRGFRFVQHEQEAEGFAVGRYSPDDHTIWIRDGRGEIDTLSVLTHELVHAVHRDEPGHGPLFWDAARRLDFHATGRGSFTHPGPRLRAELELIASDMLPQPSCWLGYVRS